MNIQATNEDLFIQLDVPCRWLRQPNEDDAEWQARCLHLITQHLKVQPPAAMQAESFGPKLTCSQCGNACTDHHIEHNTGAVWCPTCVDAAGGRKAKAKPLADHKSCPRCGVTIPRNFYGNYCAACDFKF